MLNQDGNQRNRSEQVEENYSFNRRWLVCLLLLFEIGFILAVALSSRLSITNTENLKTNEIQYINLFVLVGFGFFLTIYKTYSATALTYVIFIYAIGFQTFLICDALIWKQIFNSEPSTQVELVSDYINQSGYAILSIIIGYGAIFGKIGAFEIFIFTFLGIIGYTLNENILGMLQSPVFIDGGGSTFVHCYGAYYGLAVSCCLFGSSSKKPAQSYIHSVYGMIGVLFLWICWPSFNAGFVFNKIIPEANLEREKTFIYLNTRFALCGSCISSFIWSIFFKDKVQMEHIMNGSLAGGVIIGASSNILCAKMGIGISLIIGFVGGLITILSMVYLQPRLLRVCGIKDERGVHNLHGLPGLIGGLLSALVILGYQNDAIHNDHVNLYFYDTYKNELPSLAGRQAAGTAISVIMGIGMGLIVGGIIRLLYYGELLYRIQNQDHYGDHEYNEFKAKEKQLSYLQRLDGQLIELRKKEEEGGHHE